MQKILFSLFLLTLTVRMAAQEQPEPPYKKHPFYPPVKLLLPDSTGWFTKSDLPRKTPVMLVLFNPHCEHCQHETEELTREIGLFKKVQIVMATTAPLGEMKAFIEKYALGTFSNIVVGRDTGFFLPVYFDIHNLPFHAFFNKKLDLLSVFHGSMTVEKSLAELSK